MDLNPVGIHFQRRQARHSCSIQNQTRFQAPSGAEYAAPTGLGNWVARVATKISLLTEQVGFVIAIDAAYAFNRLMATNKKQGDRKLMEEFFIGMPKKITKLVESESDRGAILILSAYLEEILGLVVRANCVSEVDAENLLEFRRPAGDFDSKISLCKAFALISPDESQALNYVRKVRNQAAHFDRKGGRGFDVLFDSPKTIDLVDSFAKALKQELATKDAKGVRQAFTLCCRFLAIRLYMRLFESRPPQALKSLKEKANELRVEMKDTKHGKLLTEVERQAREGNPEKLFEFFQNTMAALQTAISKQQNPNSSSQPVPPQNPRSL
jgi:hypothetical protein